MVSVIKVFRCWLLHLIYGVWTAPTIQAFGIWVLSIDSDDLPVHFPLIDHGQDAKNFHLDHLTWKAHLKNRPANYYSTVKGISRSLYKVLPGCHTSYLGPDLTHVNGIVVPTTLCLFVCMVWVLPRLFQGAVQKHVRKYENSRNNFNWLPDLKLFDEN